MKECGSRRPFPATHWSAVGRASRSEGEEGLAALDALLREYYPALEAHLMFKYRRSQDQAVEILQEFTAEKILRKGLLSKAERRRGLFRTFLLNALDNFYLNQVRAGRAQRRAPPNGIVSMEELPGFDPPQADGQGNSAFDETWALRVMEIVLERMRAECRLVERPDIYQVFEGRILGPLLDGKPKVEYEDLVARFGFESSTQASNVLMTGKRMFARLLETVVGEYVSEGESVAEEIEALKTILSRACAWDARKPGKD